MPMTFDIVDWCALAPGLGSANAWQAWAAHGNAENGEQPACPHIPAMLRRRMSAASRLAVETALTLAERCPCTSAIFISRHGELGRTTRLVEQIAAREPLSPTDFSQSVHNTAAGLFTIAGKLRIPLTSIAAMRDGFAQGFQEALCSLYGNVPGAAAGQGPRILMVAFDDVPPAVYLPYLDERPMCYAIGLVLERGPGWSVRPADGPAAGPDDAPQALQFLKAWLSGQAAFRIAGRRGSWEWESHR